MNLSEIREKFVEFSGRYDLVNSNDSDNGANFFIQKGQDFLDRHAFENRGKVGKAFRKLSTGQYQVSLTRCRFVKEVWIVDSFNKNRTKLCREFPAFLYSEFEKTLAALDTGTPLYWTGNASRAVDTSLTVGSIAQEFFSDIVSGSGVTSIVFLPGVSSDNFHLEIVGEFYSKALVEDTDTSFWSDSHEEILLLAALMRLESFYRNTQGTKDALSALNEALKQLDFDMVSQEIVDIDQIGG